MSRLTVLTLICALMLIGSVAHAQSVVHRATAGTQPDVFVWVDSPGGTRTDTDTARFKDIFAGSTWLFLDDGVLLIRQGETLVASANYRPLDDTNTFWALHNRREYTLDGSADRDLDDPRIGGATLYVTVDGDDEDEFITARIEIELTFTQ